MEQTKKDWAVKILVQILIVLVCITKGVCWLLKTIFSYTTDLLDSALKQLKQQKETSNVIDVKAEGTSEERAV